MSATTDASALYRRTSAVQSASTVTSNVEHFVRGVSAADQCSHLPLPSQTAGLPGEQLASGALPK